MCESILDALYAVFCRGFSFSYRRGYADEIVRQGPDTGQEPVDHDLEVRPYVPEKVDQHDPVDAAVRVVADRDERTVRQLFKHFCEGQSRKCSKMTYIWYRPI